MDPFSSSRSSRYVDALIWVARADVWKVVVRTRLMQSNAGWMEERTRLAQAHTGLGQSNTQLTQRNTGLRRLTTALKRQHARWRQENAWLTQENAGVLQGDAGGVSGHTAGGKRAARWVCGRTTPSRGWANAEVAAKDLWSRGRVALRQRPFNRSVYSGLGHPTAGRRVPRAPNCGGEKAVDKSANQWQL